MSTTVKSRGKNTITRNYLYNLSYQLVTLFTPLITTPYLSRVLGADGIGTYSYTSSIVAYFILLASLGVGSYAEREIAYHQDSRAEQSRIFYEVLILRVLLVTLSAGLYLAILSAQGGDRTIFLIQGLNILAVLFDISFFFQGLEEFGKIVLRNLVVRILNIALIFAFIHEASDLALYIFLMAAMNVLANLSIWAYLPRYLVRVERASLRPLRNIRVIIELFIPQIAIQIYTVLDKTMLGLMTGLPAENGYYEQAEKISKMTLMVVTSLGAVMLPRIASAYARGDSALIHSYIMRSYRFVWLLGLPLMLGLIVTIDTLVPWFFGPGFERVTVLTWIFSALIILIGISNVTGVQYMIPVKMQNVFTMTVAAGAVTNLLLNIVLIPRYMSVGAAIASVLAEVAVTVVQLYVVRAVFRPLAVLALARPYVVAGATMVAGLLATRYALALPAAPLATLLLAVVGVVTYSAALYAMRDEFFLDIAGRVLRRLK